MARELKLLIGTIFAASFLLYGLAACEVAGQLTVLDRNPYELVIGEVPASPAVGPYPNGAGVMFQLKRKF